MSGSEGTPKPRRLVIGLDCGSSTGLAVVDGDTDEVIQVGRFMCKDPVPGDRYKRFISGFMGEMRTLAGVSLREEEDADFIAIGIEMPHHRGRAATEYAYGYLAFTEYLAKAYAFDGAPVVRVHTSSLKKFATGNGRAAKEDMLRRANEVLARWGFETVTIDDIADALWVALYTANKIREEDTK